MAGFPYVALGHDGLAMDNPPSQVGNYARVGEGCAMDEGAGVRFENTEIIPGAAA